MTIRLRNRLLKILFFVCIALMLFYAGMLLYKYFTNTLVYPPVQHIKNKGRFFLTKYSPEAVIISIFMELLYICITMNALSHNFEKTQSPDIFYFCFYLYSFIFDSVRVLIPVFNIAGILSKPLFAIGNIIIISKILGPIGLLLTNLLNSEKNRQNLDRNSAIIIVTSLFFAALIPLNTTTILPNFTVSYAYSKLIYITTIIIIILNAVTMFIYNNEQGYKQITTIGFTIMSFGYINIQNCTSFISLFFSVALLSSGTILYLKPLHKQYLLND